MDRRLQLQTVLEDLLGSRNVYFQPPETVKLKYPCIVYQRGNLDGVKYANDKIYQNRIHYIITVIDKNPDSDILQSVQGLPMSSFQRHYTSDNLNHDIFNIYY